MSSPSRVDSRMLSRSVSAIAAKNANSSFPGPVGSAGQGPGEHLQDQAVGREVVGEAR
ncbi:hypothetical protein [Streptomyces sp. NPDC088726]|uniref:hypothetical protein n=1 Tax=Streptomyces sp. NPDC088726 TaxID=3365874 RepID=UPI00381C7A05